MTPAPRPPRPIFRTTRLVSRTHNSGVYNQGRHRETIVIIDTKMNPRWHFQGNFARKSRNNS